MADIELKGVTKKIKGNTVLEDINLYLKPGKIYGLRGKNGCGKTMLMRTICGLILPTEGEVIIDGKVLHKDISFPPSLGALIENPAFLKEYSGKKNLELLARMSGKYSEEMVMTALERVDLIEDCNKSYGKYSLGMKQKLGIAYAILNEPDIIVLDEPINALDENAVDKIKKNLLELRDKGKLIIVACHDREELDYLSDEIYVMSHGRLLGLEGGTQ